MKANAFSLLLSALVAALSLSAGGRQANAVEVQKPSHGLLARASGPGSDQLKDPDQAVSATYEGKFLARFNGGFWELKGGQWLPREIPCTADDRLLPYETFAASGAGTPSIKDKREGAGAQDNPNKLNRPNNKGISKRSLALHRSVMLDARSKHLRKREEGEQQHAGYPSPDLDPAGVVFTVQDGDWIANVYLNAKYNWTSITRPCLQRFYLPVERSDENLTGNVSLDTNGNNKDSRDPSDPSLACAGTGQLDEDPRAVMATYEGKSFVFLGGAVYELVNDQWWEMRWACTRNEVLLPYQCSAFTGSAEPVPNQVKSEFEKLFSPQSKGISKRSLAPHKNVMLAARSQHLRKREGEAQQVPTCQVDTCTFYTVKDGQWKLVYPEGSDGTHWEGVITSPCSPINVDNMHYVYRDGQPARGQVISNGKEDNRDPSDPGLRNGYRTAKNGVKQGYEQAKDGVKDAYSGTTGYLSNRYEDGKNHLSDMYEGRKQYVSDKYDDAKDDVKDASNDVKNLGNYFGNIPGRLWNGVKNDYEKQTNKEQQPHPNNDDE